MWRSDGKLSQLEALIKLVIPAYVKVRDRKKCCDIRKSEIFVSKTRFYVNCETKVTN